MVPLGCSTICKKRLELFEGLSEEPIGATYAGKEGTREAGEGEGEGEGEMRRGG